MLHLFCIILYTLSLSTAKATTTAARCLYARALSFCEYWHMVTRVSGCATNLGGI